MIEGADEEEVTLLDLVLILKKNILLIVGATIFVGIVTFSILLFVSNIYVSKAVLMPRAQERGGSMSGLSGGLGALAGIKIGGDTLDNSTTALELMKTRKFILNFIKSRDILVELFAMSEWKDGEAQIDSGIYDIKSKRWVRDVPEGKSPEPMDSEIYEQFSDIFSIKEDDKGFVTVSLENISPVLAQRWLSWLIDDLNFQMKKREQKELVRGIDFLNERLKHVELQEVRTAFVDLLAEQTRKLMMTESSDDFVFEVLDPPFLPEKPAKPKKILIMIIVLMGSMIIASSGVIMRELLKRKAGNM